MRARWLCLCTMAVLGASSAGAAEFTTLPAPGGAGIERGIALLRCATATPGVFSHSRGTILDVGVAADADVLLTTAHGLPSDAAAVRRGCRVLARGKQYAIDAVWHAGGDLTGPENDWTVLLTRRIGGDVQRWRAGRLTPDALAKLVSDAAPVRLLMRYAGAAQSDCHLEPQRAGAPRLLAHSCTSYPGLSGSALVVGVERAPVVIAVHVGSQLYWDGTRLDMVSVARPLDAEIAVAIEAAITAADQGTPNPRR